MSMSDAVAVIKAMQGKQKVFLNRVYIQSRLHLLVNGPVTTPTWRRHLLTL